MPLSTIDENGETVPLVPTVQIAAEANAGQIAQPQELVVQDIPKDKQTPTFSETAQAVFQQEDFIFNLYSAATAEQDKTFDPNFNALEELKRTRPDLVSYADKLSNVHNAADYVRKVAKIDYENDNRNLIARAPTHTKILAGLAAGVADPINLVPILRAAKVISTTGRVAYGIVTGGATLGAVTAGEEAALLATQATRTKEESFMNVIAATALGSILGGATGALSNPVRDAGKTLLAKAMKGEDYKIEISEAGVPKVVGEAGSDLDKLGIAHINETLVKVLSGPEALRPPDLRAIMSPSATVRSLGDVFYNSNYIRKKHAEGEASGLRAQNGITQRDSQHNMTLHAVDQLYLEHTDTGALRAMVARPAGKISPKEFNDRVWLALTDDTVVDSISQVNKAAKLIRKDMDSLTGELQAAKLIDENIDPKFARNYMSRVYDVDKLHSPQVRASFIDRVGNWLVKHNKDGSIREVPISKSEAARQASLHLDKVRGETDQQISMSAILENAITKGKFTKERSLLIPDSEIKDFLQTDASRLFKNYSSKASRLLESQAALQRAGFADFPSVIKAMRKEAVEATTGVSPEEAIKLGKKFADEEKLANDMYRSILGQLKKPGFGDRFTEGLMNYQFLRLLGGVTISSLADLAATPFRMGFLNTFKHGYFPAIRDLKTYNLSNSQLNHLHGALEFEQSNVIRAFSGIDNFENLGRNTNSWDVTMQILTKGFIKATGIGFWTGLGRRVSTQVSAARTVEMLKKATLGADEIEHLASIGIGKKDYAAIRSQIDAHVQEASGTFVINPHLWKDQAALKTFVNAIQTDLEGAVLKPGIESTPFMVQRSNVAKIMFQFKSFLSSSTGKILISGLQRRDGTVLAGYTGMITMGILSQALKDLINNKDPGKRDAVDMLTMGISNSGMLGLVGTTVLDVSRSFYNKETSRFAGDFASSAVLGPSASQIKPIVDVTKNLFTGSVTNSEIKAGLRMIPYTNLFYLKAMTERAFPSKGHK